MKRHLAVLLLGAALLASSVAAAGKADVAEVIAAERAFARDAAERGVGPAFETHAAPDAISFAPDPVPAAPLLKRRGPPVQLSWWPVFAGIAASGDIGFTTGPYRLEGPKGVRHGHYFTVWKRQPDGRWRWVLDHGPAAAEPSPLGADAPVAALADATPGGSWDTLLAAQADLDAALAKGAAPALSAALAEDARVLRQGPQPAVGRAAYRALLDAGPASIDAAHLGGEMSKAGDLAYTYGRAVWSEGGKPVKGHYVRIWQHRGATWRLAVDEIIPSPPPPPPPPAEPAPAAPQPPSPAQAG